MENQHLKSCNRHLVEQVRALQDALEGKGACDGGLCWCGCACLDVGVFGMYIRVCVCQAVCVHARYVYVPMCGGMLGVCVYWGVCAHFGVRS